jgi:dTDP-4-amino-4,6-dideoxygalactose transaminase
LHAAYYATGIGPGDEIVTTAMTFAATSNAALYLGARPKFADIELSTGLIDPSSINHLIGTKTKAIVGVDYAGHPCDMDQLREITCSANITLIVDGAHSLGALYKHRPAGSFADMTILSFHPVKTITTGEGGMVLTNREDFCHKLRLFRTHGIEKDPSQLASYEGPWCHEMQLLGYNYRLTDIQAALGISQLTRLNDFINKRRQIASFYRKHLQHSQLFSPLEEKSSARSAYHLFPVLVNKNKLDRKLAVQDLHANNIGVQVHYIPTYKHPYYRQFVNSEQWISKCPVTEEFYSRVLSLPIFPDMSDDDVASVLAALDNLEYK